MRLHCPKCAIVPSNDDDVLPGDRCTARGCCGMIAVLPEFCDRIESLPDRMTCPRRQVLFGSETLPATDHWWRFKHNGDRVCSFCGSLHPDDFLQLVAAAAHAPRTSTYETAVGIEPSVKPYKIYVYRAKVGNAMEGGIKFYTHHLRGVELTAELKILYSLAVRASRARLESYMRALPRRSS